MSNSDLRTALEIACASRAPITVSVDGVEVTFVPSEIDEEDETVLGKTEDGRLVEFQFDEITLAK